MYKYIHMLLISANNNYFELCLAQVYLLTWISSTNVCMSKLLGLMADNDSGAVE